ncbi:MAG: HlyC/CorC family transporter [Chloroflexi bacterium]|nr:HlyC/CorC family transporter [Chloroflexota bacterium]
MDGISGLFLTLLVISLGFAAFFCSAETAFIGFQKLRLQHLIEKGDLRAKTVAKIVEHPEKFLATVLLGVNFFETAAATLATIIAVDLWGENLGAAVATVVVTIVTLVLAEFIPKSLAARFGEKIALAYAGPITVISVIFYPFVYLLKHIGIRFSRLAGEDGHPRPTISEAEVRTAITVGHREGTVETETAEMLHNVFEFADRPVREVMAPRMDVIFVEKGATLADFFELYVLHPVSRYPVYEERRDNVVGILSVWDVLLAVAKGTISKDSAIDELIRPAHFVPETKPVSELLAEMRDKNFQIAIVVDEFGGTAGIASFNQLVEEIVGPVGDGLAGAEKDFEVIDEHTFQIDGGMRVEEVNEEMSLGLPEGDYETVAGFILHLLHRIPKQGEQIKWRNLKLVITKMSGLKIEEIMVTKEKGHLATETVQSDAASTN